jgi:hypothetical protein
VHVFQIDSFEIGVAEFLRPQRRHHAAVRGLITKRKATDSTSVTSSSLVAISSRSRWAVAAFLIALPPRLADLS